MKNERIIIDFKSDEGNGYIKGVQEELSKRFEYNDAYVHIKINNDNLVPSIEMKEQFDLFINNKYGVPTKGQLDIIKKFMKWSDKQYGVETNKVQPDTCNCGKYSIERCVEARCITQVDEIVRSVTINR